MINLYRRTSKESLEGQLLIDIRTLHIKAIAREFIKHNIVPNAYLDNLIKIDALKKHYQNINHNSINLIVDNIFSTFDINKDNHIDIDEIKKLIH